MHVLIAHDPRFATILPKSALQSAEDDLIWGVAPFTLVMMYGGGEAGPLGAKSKMKLLLGGTRNSGAAASIARLCSL